MKTRKGKIVWRKDKRSLIKTPRAYKSQLPTVLALFLIKAVAILLVFIPIVFLITKTFN